MIGASDMNVESRKRFIINITFLAIIVAIFYLFLKYAVGWIMPFIIALIIAFCIQRPVAWLSKKTKLKRKTICRKRIEKVQYSFLI